MPRWPKREGDEAVNGQGEVVKTPVSDAPRAERKEFVAYAGKESLPDYKVITPAKNGKTAVIEYGEPRFVVHPGERKTKKVIAYYKSPHGVLRKVWAVLKPTSLRPKDQAILARLKACNIPGA